jgi:aminoglycoside phosphotransferase (APT) family kinase protein
LGLDPADVRIDNLRMLARSLSRTTWGFDAVTPNERRALVLYAGQPGLMGGSFEVQARAQVAAAANGVPVPHILAGDDSAGTLGNPFLISDMVKGETDHSQIVAHLDRVDRQAGRGQLLQQCAHALAGIHRVNATAPEPARPQRLAICRQKLDSPGNATATFEWAFRWLTTHEPPPAPTVLVHGDYRMGNLLVDGSDLKAVLDWEWVHVGEANEDLAWFCIRTWRHGAPASLGAGGLGSIESFLRAYEQASGTRVDRVGFHWWRVMATLFFGVLQRDQAQIWLSEKDPSTGSAVMGRRICETEWDLLNLLDEVTER